MTQAVPSLDGRGAANGLSLLDRWKIAEQRGECHRERVDVGLLTLEREHRGARRHLKVEGARTRKTHGSGHESIDVGEVVGRAHDGLSVPRSPVSLTVRTLGPHGPNAIAVTEQVEIEIRWNRSRCVPRAWATAALIGSAWLNIAMVPPR